MDFGSTKKSLQLCVIEQENEIKKQPGKSKKSDFGS